MDASLLANKTITAIYTFACVPVHAAWVNELTTPIATSIAILELSGGELIRVAPCEVEVDSGKYPSLGLSLELCDAMALRREMRGAEPLLAQPLAIASDLLPFTTARVEESDPLGEGAVSEMRLLGWGQESLLFRHIMPPMTLGMELAGAGQAPNRRMETDA